METKTQINFTGSCNNFVQIYLYIDRIGRKCWWGFSGSATSSSSSSSLFCWLISQVVGQLVDNCQRKWQTFSPECHLRCLNYVQKLCYSAKRVSLILAGRKIKKLSTQSLLGVFCFSEELSTHFLIWFELEKGTGNKSIWARFICHAFTNRLWIVEGFK